MADSLLTQPCQTGCPVARTARIIEGKWTTLIVRDLLGGTRRFSQLQASLAGISAKVLTERLRLLEQQGLVTKTIYPTIPPKTEYALTAKGLALRHVIAAMAVFGADLDD